MFEGLRWDVSGVQSVSLPFTSELLDRFAATLGLPAGRQQTTHVEQWIVKRVLQFCPSDG